MSWISLPGCCAWIEFIRRYSIRRTTALFRQTYAEDNDPLDVLVLCQEAVQPLALIEARAIGVMTMVDSGASDDKIISVATNDQEFSSYLEARDLPPHRLLVLKRFFQDYKQLEGNRFRWKISSRHTPRSQ